MNTRDEENPKAEITATDALAFSVTASPGQPSLVWVNLLSTVKGDAR